jgi:hypothetical protein
MTSKRMLLSAAFLAIVGFLSTPLLADDETDILRFREPVIVQHGQEVTSAVSIGSYVQVDGTVRENAVSIGGDIRLGPTGVVEGDAVAIGGKVVQVSGSHVSGKVTSTGSSLSHLRRALAAAVPALMVGIGVLAGAAIVAGSVGSIALAAVVLFLFPDQVRCARAQLDMRPWACFWMGALAVFLTIPILTFLCLTIIGIPLSFVIAVVAMSAFVLGTVGLGQWVGLRLAKQLKRPMPSVAAGLVGLLILTLLCSLPYIGPIIQILVVCFSLGMVVYSRFRSTLPGSTAVPGA